jgi:pyruvate/2-oxoglutarate dehydrogenase complex dihydrolipoamide acyltransferase (E2) component
MVSVSGIAEAEQTAELAFPVVGTVREVLVEVGDKVAAGDTLVTIDARTLYADRQDALANLAQAIATRDELIAGPTASARTVTNETIASKQKTLETTRESEAQKVTNAYRTLLSTDLTAYSKDANEDATPPTVSGTYACNDEGIYKIEMYSSSAESGYSYKLTGIETGTYSVSTEQPIPLGNCGLRIQFDANSTYNRSIL